MQREKEREREVQQQTKWWREKMKVKRKEGRGPRKEGAQMEGNNVRDRELAKNEGREDRREYCVRIKKKEVNSLLFSELLQGG